jgi:tetratricopeptide (TPR) repeat protein
MLATKNLRLIPILFFAATALCLIGCTPAGPRALLDGKKLLEKGRYADAVDKLTTATALMKTNAAAWNYLGLACHRAGDPVRAAKAYQQALVLDRELFEARYNLGCLLLEQNKMEAAKTEFTACTLRRSNSIEAWLKLATVTYRLGELAAAEQNFRHVLRLNANEPEALNGLGLVNLQRKRPRDAAQHFALALKQKPDYRPALLNLATVCQRQLNDPSTAMQKYREYLALEPRDSDWSTVSAIAQSLQEQISSSQSTANVPVTRPVTNTPPPVRPALPAPTQSVAVVKTSAPPPVPTAVKVSSSAQQPTFPPPEVVQLPPEPVIRSADAPRVEELPSVRAETPTMTTGNEPAEIGTPSAKTEKRGFLSRLNPFHRDVNTATQAGTNTVPSDAPATSESTVGEVTKAGTRYRYHSPAPPTPGNRAEAERAFTQGVRAQEAKRTSEAVTAFSRAVQLDSSYFEARYNLGLAQYALRDYDSALATWEYALATKPESTEARYNFALTLKSGGYALDSAAELERIVASSPNDVRAHLVLGNLYAEQLQSPAKARPHYQRVLDLEPRHPQSAAIRYWMVANPP